MHSSLVRLQNVFGFFTSVAFAVSAVIAASVLLIPQAPSSEVTARGLQVVKGRPHYYSKEKTEYAVIRFDIEADLTSLFNWNTKQLFVWVAATYPSTNSSSPADAPLSEAVIWDTIINSPSQTNPPSMWELVGLNPYNNAASKPKTAGRSPSKKPTGTPGKISLRNVKPKYQISDPSGHIASTANVTLRLGYNVQPWVGALAWTQRFDFNRWTALAGGVSKAFSLPAIKTASKIKEPSYGPGAKAPVAGEAEPIVNMDS